MRRARWTAVALGVALLLAAAASGAVVQNGNLRITVLGQVKPFQLPRHQPGPIAVFIAGHLDNVEGGVPPQLKRMTIRVNRHGLLQSRGLPVCRLGELQASTTERALSVCGDALIGSGRFWASIIFPDQHPYRTRGRLLVFNGRVGCEGERTRPCHPRPALFAHVFTTKPFASSFVLTFSLHHLAKGRYGTLLTASLPKTLGDWGYLDRIKLTLRRKYRFHGRELSYFNAACPAPPGFANAVFPLALVRFSFAGGVNLDTTLTKTCRAHD